MELKLNLGCGEDYKKGFVNVDVCGKCDLKHDLNVYPYPFKDGSVSKVLAYHILEHLENPIKFFEELHRILKPLGVLEVIVPHVNADGAAFGDFEHKNYFHESAIFTVCGGKRHNIFREKRFNHLKTKIDRGRFMFWKKRQITWTIEKALTDDELNSGWYELYSSP